MNTPKVNFFLIGTQKGGTTSLYNYLSQHPSIFLPQTKEIHFFTKKKEYIKGENSLNKFFKKYNGEKSVGSAYVHMLPCIECPERVYKYNPNAKIIICLRNPIDRAYSAYNMAVKNGWEQSKTSFLDAMKLEPTRLIKGNHTEKYDLAYFNNGFYYKHIKNWLNFFNKDQIHLIETDNLNHNRQVEINKVLTFLELNNNFYPTDDSKFHQGGGVRYPFIHKLLLNKEANWRRIVTKIIPHSIKQIGRNILNKILSWNISEAGYEKITDKEREYLQKYYENDLLNLKTEFKIDLLNKKS